MKKAVAISYKQNLPAPFIIAKGKDAAARKILEIAGEHNIHVMNEEELTERLFMIEVGDYIPEEIYDIVAEILAYVYMTQSHLERA